MDNRRSQGTLFTEYMNVRHHVVPRRLFFFSSGFEIDVIHVSFHFGNLFRLDRQAELLKNY